MMYVGVDIAKLKFDVCFDAHQIQRAKQKKKYAAFANTVEGIEDFCAQLPQDVLVVFESTGRYSKLLYKMLCEKGVKCACINPYRLVQFKNAMGRFVKSDKPDAESLSLYGYKMEPRATQFIDEKDAELQELVRSRDVLIENIRQYQNRLEVPYVSDCVNKTYQEIIDILEGKLKAKNQEINEFMERNEAHKGRRDRLITLKGVGAVTAVGLLAHCPELGKLSRQEIGALSGTCPYTKESGNTYMTEHICGGRPELRRTLYMAAQVARRYDPEMHRLYERLISKGKPTKIALVAVMRKLLIRANSTLKKENDYVVRGTLSSKVLSQKKVA